MEGGKLIMNNNDITSDREVVEQKKEVIKKRKRVD